MDTIILVLSIFVIVGFATAAILFVKRRKPKEVIATNLAYDPQFLAYAQKDTEVYEAMRSRTSPSSGYTFPNAPANPSTFRRKMPCVADVQRERTYSLDPLYTTPLYLAAVGNGPPSAPRTPDMYSGHGGEFGGGGSSSSYGDSSPADSSPSSCDSGSSGGGDCGGGSSD